MSPKKFRSPEAEFVGCSIPRNQSLSPKDNRSVQLNSSQEVVLQVGPQVGPLVQATRCLMRDTSVEAKEKND